MANGLFESSRRELLEMTMAALESISWRQDRYRTGGIVESDERVDGGRKLYWPWCWPRTFVLEPLLMSGRRERAERLLEFFLRRQREDGSWWFSYNILDGSENPGKVPETDTVGYMLRHIRNYAVSVGGRKWVDAHWQRIERAVGFLSTKINPDVSLIWGAEEANVPGYGDCIPGYPLHMNVICALGLQSAAELAELAGKHGPAAEWSALAERIKCEGIEAKLWDDREQTFAFCLREDGRKVMAPALWMTLMPHFVFDRWDDRIDGTLDYLDRTLYNRDPVIPHTYWFYDYRPWMDSGDPFVSKGTGFGVWVGGLPVLIDVCLKAGRRQKAREQLEKMIELTDPRNHLIPEHVNTMHPGRIGKYSTYPDSSRRVDSGNLLHLSYFLTLIARRAPDLLREASKRVDERSSHS